ncbi:PREDICTED: sodium/bile acid cotransporter 5 [Hipposideros armiger]|uniref:Sodium/bile acid cotransporter 5 n=1 Tax=Hipposideros armiger TaxID=186990 RepID=A0A8B7S715_HIPAR|nr:PREDICTED: sodium/bile acid cotransporter 5 [Hipposideros armiger]
MIRELRIVLLLSIVTLGEARKPFLSFLNIENPEIALFTKTEDTVVIRSSYRDQRPNSSYLSVQVGDPHMLQVVNVTKTLADVTSFVLHLVPDEEGETNLTVRLWASEDVGIARGPGFWIRDDLHVPRREWGLPLCSAPGGRYHFGHFDDLHIDVVGPDNDACQFLHVQPDVRAVRYISYSGFENYVDTPFHPCANISWNSHQA